MSTKDPLLSALKVCILSLKSEGGAITDSNPQLSSCCQLLELILRKGLHHSPRFCSIPASCQIVHSSPTWSSEGARKEEPVLGFVQRDYWHCVDQLPQVDSCGSRLSLISLALEQTSACKKLLTAQGRGRYFLRLALKRRILGSVVQHLSHTRKLLEWYNPTISIVRNDEFMEPFLSLLLVLSELDFNLKIENCSFLDDSWLLPVCDVYEVVPCRELGIVLRYLGGRVFVLDLIEGSQAQVDGCVLPGDIIDEINGISLRNASNRQAGTVLAQLRGAPLSLRVLRWRAEDGSVYRPVVRLLRELQREHPSLRLHPTPPPPPRQESQCLRDGRIVYIVQYLGKASVGMYGGKEVLQHGIALVLEQNRPKKAVLFDLKETHVTCMEKATKQEIFQYHYPEISCVGRYSQSDHTIFAFCVADCLEPAQSTRFSCMAMRAGSAQECEAIVTRIAIGFKHTEGFV